MAAHDERKRNMEAYLPNYYYGMRESDNLMEQEAVELEGLSVLISDLEKQLYIDTATWGIEQWERLVEITPDDNTLLELRRFNVKRKFLSESTITAEYIISLIKTFVGGYSDVVEDFSTYTLRIAIFGERGEPQYINELTKAVREMLPAHIAFEFTYSYPYWDELERAKVRWRDLEGMTWDTFSRTFFDKEEEARLKGVIT